MIYRHSFKLLVVQLIVAVGAMMGVQAQAQENQASDLSQSPQTAQQAPGQIQSYEDYTNRFPDQSQIAYPEFSNKRRLSGYEKLAAFLATMGIAFIIAYVVLKWGQRRRLILNDELGLGNVAVTDNALQHIPGLDKRKALDLSGTTISDSGAAQLATLINLEELNLSGTMVGDEGVKHLAELPALHTLNLAHSMVTDAGVAHLKNKTSLRVLLLNNTHITSSAVDSLISIRGLRYLNLANTPVTAAEAARLRAELTFCEVISGDAAAAPEYESALNDQSQTGPLFSNYQPSNHSAKELKP